MGTYCPSHHAVCYEAGYGLCYSVANMVVLVIGVWFVLAMIPPGDVMGRNASV